MPRTRRTPIDQGFQTSGQSWDDSSLSNDVSFGGQHYQEIQLNFSIYIPGALDDAYVSTVMLWDTGLVSLGPATAAQIAFVDSGADPWTGNGGAGFPGQFIAFDYTPGVRHDYYHYAIGVVDYSFDPDYGFEYWDAVSTAFFDFDGGQLIIDESGFAIVDDYTYYGGWRLGSASENTFGASNEAYWDWSSWLQYTGSIVADVLTGTEFSDRITGYEGADTLTGGAGRDVFEYWTPGDSSVATGMDRITDFQTGHDVIDVQNLEISAIWAQWVGGVYRLNIQTTPGTLVIESVLPITADDVRGDNWLHLGTPFADMLPGRQGSNVFDGGGGGDTLDGGAGPSTFRYDAVSDSTAATGIDRIAHFGSDDRIVVEGITASGLSVNWAFDVMPVQIVLATPGGDLQIDFANASTFTAEGFRNLVQVSLAVAGTPDADSIEGAGLADSLDGKDGSDTLEGYAGDDTLDGGGGDDLVRGHEGNDQINGGTGNDLIDAGSGSNTIHGGSGDDTLTAAGSSGDNAVFGDDGNDYIDIVAGNNAIDGGAGDDTIRAGTYENIDGGVGIDTVILDPYLRVNLAEGLIRTYGGTVVGTITGVENLAGVAGVNELIGDALDNHLSGSAGADTLDGGGGNNTLEGGGGSDLYHVRSSSDVIIEAPESWAVDTVYSYVASFALPEEIENARIRITGAADLTGNGKDNLLYAGSGDNTIDGRAGIDTVSYAEGISGATGVVVRLDTVTAQATGGSGTDTLLNVENLIGSNYDDALTGNALANRLEGGAGNDTLVGALGGDTLLGGAGNNSIDGGGGANEIHAGAGDAGNNTIIAGSGANHLSIYSYGSTSITLGSGNNTIDLHGGGSAVIRTGNGNNAITAWHNGLNDIRTGKGADIIVSSGLVRAMALDDSVTGLGGNDTLYGGAGNDTLAGGAGSDQLFGEGGNDVLSDFFGNNLLYGGAGTDLLEVDLQGTGYHSLLLANDTDGSVYFTSGAGTTRAFSVEGARLGGTPQDDTITGAAWDDTIDGGGGADVIDGAGGVDTVVLEFDADSYAYVVLGDGQPVEATGGPVSLANIEAMQTTGTPNDDLFVGGSGNDDIRSNGGDDVIQGLGGNDVLGAVVGDLRGGDGNDVLTTSGARSPLGHGPTSPYVRMPAFNDSLAKALSLDPFFRFATDPDVADSATTTHARVPVTGNGGHLYFALTVTHADTAVIIDIDEGYSAANSYFDAYLLVLNADGQQVGDPADDYPLIDPGSTSMRDSYLQLTFTQPGTYYIALSDFVNDPIPEGAQFWLNVTMDHPITSSVLYGDAGNDTLMGGTGSDMLHGGSGRDTVSFANATTSVNASLATGLAIAGSTDYLFGIENLQGSSHADTLRGDSSWNNLRGEGGNDSLFGGAGADTLHGGAGSDQLAGGTGADWFVFDAPLSAANNVDTIIDFGTGTDVIALDTAVFTSIGTGTLPEEAFYARSSGTAAHDADDRIIYNTSSGKLYYDADGNLPGANPVLFAIVGTSTHAALAASEFVGV